MNPQIGKQTRIWWYIGRSCECYGDNLTEFERSNPLPTSFRLLNDPNRCVCNRGSEVAVYNVYTPNSWPLLAVLIGNRADETFHLGHSMVIPCYTSATVHIGNQAAKW
jgi:hypothetical protein